MRITTRCLIAVGVLLWLTWTTPLAVQATPPQPTYGTAVVDGNYGEWNLANDFFCNMYRAGRIDKPLESKCYLRYNCLTHTMYVLVLGQPGIPCVLLSGTSWVAINAQNNKVVVDSNNNDGIPPDFAWIDVGFDGDPTHARGYEASFSIAQGSYNIIVHTDVSHGGTMTSASEGFPGTGPPLVISCPPVPVEATTWGRLKAFYN